jgi:predicted aldo/keto reductase-like oxidoreductase
MDYRRYRNTDINVSLLGMGCMRLPGEGESVDFQKAEEIIDCAYKSGINYFDTAYIYGAGESEKALGQALKKYPRESFMVATKLPVRMGSTRENTLKCFEEQLARLQMDYIDFYLMHNVNEKSIDKILNSDFIETLDELKAEGKIRHLGFSSHGSCETLERFAKLRDWDFAQIQLNYFDWDYLNSKRQYEILSNLGIPIIIMEPVRGGRLADICPEANKLFKDYAPERSISSWALRFAAQLPDVLTVLSGMSTVEQVKDNVKTFSPLIKLNTDEQKILEKAAYILRDKDLMPCTACHYCSECPVGLDIPLILNSYNNYILSKFPLDLLPVDRLPEDKKPDKCTGCRLCVSRCPQNIDVPKALAFVAAESVKVFEPALDM